jgi:DNA-binding response OmpR family regulator
MVARRRVLILDDETRVAFFLRETLEALGHDLEVVSVSTPEQALQEVNREPFDLFVTDQHLPGMNGLDLIGQVRELHSGTRFILMTAYGSEEALARARRLGAYQYFTKPFRIEEFVQTVLDALEGGDGQLQAELPTQQADVLVLRLEELRREVGAQCVLASQADGTIVAQAGGLVDLKLDQILPLAADGFSTSQAMAHRLGGTHTGNLTYFEGARHDIYTANVEEDLFLMIIFDRRIQASRIGIVWLYARRAIDNLRQLTAVLPAGVGMD